MRSKRRTSRRLALVLMALGLMLPSVSGLASDTDLFTATVPPNVVFIVDNSISMKSIVWHPAYDPAAANPDCNYYDDDAFVFFFFGSTVTLNHCTVSRTLDRSAGGWTYINGGYANWLMTAAADPYFSDITDMSNGTRSSCVQSEYGLGATYSKYNRTRVAAAKEVLREVICNVNQQGDVRFGLAQFEDESDPEGGYLVVPVDDYDTAHGTAIATFIDALAGDTYTPLAETLYNVYRYFQSRTSPILGDDGSTYFPAYEIEPDGTTDTPANVPDTPVQYACQRNFIVLITDGEPTKDDFSNMDHDRFIDLIGDYNSDNTNPEAGDEEPGDSCGFCIDTTFFLDDIAKFMHEHDFQNDFAGTQTIDVYTVGFTTGNAANALLQKTADVSDGLFKQSSDPDQLTVAIIEAITDIIDKAHAFTSATVPASRTTDGNNFYSSFFLPKENSGFWEGHLKNFEFSASGEILTPSGTCATGLDTTATPPCAGGTLRAFETAFWDAAEEMPAPASRKLYIEYGGNSMFSQPARMRVPVTALEKAVYVVGFGLTAADASIAPYSGLSPNTTSDMAVALAQVLEGCEFSAPPCVPRVNASADKIYLGDTFHSNPVVVGSPNAPINEASYREFASVWRERPRVIYAGANDGFLHGFQAGEWQDFESDGVTPLVPPRHDRGTGEEIFGFMPYSVRNAIKELPTQTSFPRTLETVDGSPIVADVWMYRNVSGGNMTTVNPLLDPDNLVDERWRTMLIGGLRDGGAQYYALDVTDPPLDAATATSSYPRYLWGFPCENCVNAVNGGTASETTYMANTWSEPVITRVRVAVDGGTNPRGYDRWVAIFGAGYHPYGDPNGSDYRVPSDAGFEPKGRGIYMVDITTGEVLAKKVFDSSASALTDINTPQIGVKEFYYAFPSAPAVYDLDFDGYADVIYIGDAGGQLWKWVVHPVGDDPINNSVGNYDLAQPDWPFRRVFVAETSTGTAAERSGGAWSSSVHYQSFFFPPTGALRNGKLVLAFGSGERANAKGKASEYGDGDPSNNNHYFVIKDVNPTEVASTVHPINDSIVEADLDDLEDGTVLTCSAMQATKSGYFITGRDAEKFITNSVIFLGTVFTGSFIPPDPMTSDPCDTAGQSYLYAFDLDCGIGLFTTESTDSDRRRKAIGSGIPTRPRVSVGGLNQGGGGGPCANRVVVITSDGNVENECPGPLPSSGVNIRSWRER